MTGQISIIRNQFTFLQIALKTSTSVGPVELQSLYYMLFRFVAKILLLYFLLWKSADGHILHGSQSDFCCWVTVERLTAKFSFKNFDVFRQEEMYLTDAREVSIISVDTKTSLFKKSCF